MSRLLEETHGACPRCGSPLDMVDGEATRELGEREYVCPNCGWIYETGTSPLNGVDTGF